MLAIKIKSLPQVLLSLCEIWNADKYNTANDIQNGAICDVNVFSATHRGSEGKHAISVFAGTRVAQEW